MMARIEVEHLPEVHVPGRRLGRHREHDERSRAFEVEASGRPVRSVLWQRRSEIFDQGEIRACTGNAMAGALATDSLHRQGRADVTESTALRLYELATHLDSVPGEYPPDDTGSSGNAVMKAAKRLHLITGYRHAFSFESVLNALQSGPVITGITWLTGCDNPDANGLVAYEGDVRGGHEIELVGCDIVRRTVTFANSWSASWGAAGFFSMSWDGYRAALKDGGDATIPVYA